MADLSKQTQDFKTAWFNLLSQYAVGEIEGGSISTSRFNLIGMVKVKINEVIPEGEGIQFAVQDLANTSDVIDIYINALLDDSANTLLQTAPLFKIIGKSHSGTATANPDGSGYIPLPTDFIRLQALKLNGWQRELTHNDLITPEKPKYRLQGNTNTRGGKAKPVGVLTTINTSDTITRVLEYYSLKKEETPIITKFIYVPVTVAENIQTNLQDALTWICAAKLLQIISKSTEPATEAWKQVEIAFKNIK